MSYWWPPDPSVYDPTPRPLTWTFSKIDGLPWPSAEDQEIFGIGYVHMSEDGKGTTPPIVTADIPPFEAPFLPQDFQTPQNLRGASATLALGGHAQGKPYTRPSFTKENQTLSDRLNIYRKLMLIHAPGDPATGGLQADSYDPTDGSFTIHYWDFSDDTMPRRKKVIYAPQAGKTRISTKEWKVDKQAW